MSNTPRTDAHTEPAMDMTTQPAADKAGRKRADTLLSDVLTGRDYEDQMNCIATFSAEARADAAREMREACVKACRDMALYFDKFMCDSDRHGAQKCAEAIEQLPLESAVEPRVAHSKTEYKRLTAQGVDVLPPTKPAGESVGDGWIPIESAPKDKFIFLWCPEDGSRWLAKWQGERWYGVDDEGLTRESMGPDDVTGWKVTRWQPLPEPPIKAAEGVA